MTEQTPSQTNNLRKKLQKREQRILVRLKRAQRAQEKALEGYHRAEERLESHSPRTAHRGTFGTCPATNK